MVDASA
ncbi:hypothetical protein CGLO_13132 [Colletotrichum gloeosporioides Cg-14]|nr:hypothetical protein CGLO_13132 [Colletotrichum gloeosporioides Cg-14]